MEESPCQARFGTTGEKKKSNLVFGGARLSLSLMWLHAQPESI